MDYSVYNDYELLYLINDGIEPALNLLHKKYYHLIYTTAQSYYSKTDKINDLVQEGRIILQECIYSFDSQKEVSFYSYFLTCYRRRIFRLLQNNYYKEYLKLEDNLYSDTDYSKRRVMMMMSIFDDEEELRIYHDIIIDGRSITEYARRYDQSYMSVYRKYNKVIEKIRKCLNF